MYIVIFVLPANQNGGIRRNCRPAGVVVGSPYSEKPMVKPKERSSNISSKNVSM